MFDLKHLTLMGTLTEIYLGTPNLLFFDLLINLNFFCNSDFKDNISLSSYSASKDISNSDLRSSYNMSKLYTVTYITAPLKHSLSKYEI